MSTKMPIDADAWDALQQRIDRSPFLGWLGVRLDEIDDEHVVMLVPWRDEFVATPELGGVNGGIIATVLDCAAGYAVMVTTRRLCVTADLRIDYHGRAAAGTLRVEARSLRIGRTLATSDAVLHDVEGKVVARARGTFINRSLELFQGKVVK